MVTAALSTLSTSARQYYSFIQQGVAQGLTNKAINEAIRLDRGRGIRKQELGIAADLARGVQRDGRAIQNVRFDRRPSYDTFKPFHPIKTDKKYLIQYEIRTVNTRTLQEETKYLTVGTNSRDTRGELDAKAIEGFEAGQPEQKYGENLRLVSVLPIGARQQII